MIFPSVMSLVVGKIDLCKLMLELDIMMYINRQYASTKGQLDIVNVCHKYDLPHELLVIEVTEYVGLIENNVGSSVSSDRFRERI